MTCGQVQRGAKPGGGDANGQRVFLTANAFSYSGPITKEIECNPEDKHHLFNCPITGKLHISSHVKVVWRGTDTRFLNPMYLFTGH